MDYLREREAAPKPLRSPGLTSTVFPDKVPSPRLEPQEDAIIESNVDFLRSMEETDKKKDKVSKHGKRSSLGSLSGTKNILAGKFGDAFKRFESSNNHPPPARTPSPLKDLARRDLTPIAGSEATDGLSDDGRMLGDSEELTPEMRRDLEAQALAEEERRVEAAAAEYRERLAARDRGGSAALPKSIGGVSRAVSIQNRVQNLLGESQKPPAASKTAEGYGRFSDAATAASRFEKALPSLPRKPVSNPTGRGAPAKPVTSSSDAISRARHTSSMPSSLTDSSSRPAMPPSKPSAPPKPTHLNNIPTGGRRSPSKQQRVVPGPQGHAAEQLVGVGVPGRPSLDMTAQEKEDYVRDFSKRFPSLSSIEMVERDLGTEPERKGGR